MSSIESSSQRKGGWFERWQATHPVELDPGLPLCSLTDQPHLAAFIDLLKPIFPILLVLDCLGIVRNGPKSGPKTSLSDSQAQLTRIPVLMGFG